jgi:hypothetical protein
MFCFLNLKFSLKGILLFQPVMVAREGYPIETHTVVTEDCYILQMHRIPFGKKSPHVKGEEPRPVVYLQHGLLCSSADWVMGAPEKSLGMYEFKPNLRPISYA